MPKLYQELFTEATTNETHFMSTAIREIKIPLPWEILLSISITDEQLIQEMRQSLAFKWFVE